MSYKDRFGGTQIIGGTYYNLEIGWDCDTDPEDVDSRYPVLLFTPDMDNTIEHHHIELSKRQAKILAKWLQDYLEEKPTRWKK